MDIRIRIPQMVSWRVVKNDLIEKSGEHCRRKSLESEFGEEVIVGDNLNLYIDEDSKEILIVTKCEKV